LHTTICLVRHGVTDWNYEGRAQGRADLPLNAEGLRQIELVAARLSAEPWDAIYSSPLSRALHTAEAIGRATGLSVTADAELAERDITPIEGTTSRDRLQRWPDSGWRRLPGMESHAACGARAKAAVLAIAGRHPGQRILCVSHGGWIYDLMDALDATHEDVFLRNTMILRLACEGETLTVTDGPDFSHLLVDGVEYSGERHRLAHALAHLASPDLPQGVVDGATAVESAWIDDRLVGFVRVFTDGVRFGYLDLTGWTPEHHAVVATLFSRLQARYPGVSFVRIDHAPFRLPSEGVDRAARTAMAKP